MCRPETVEELIQFLQAVNWMPTALPELVVVVKPLRDMLKEFEKQAPNTARGRQARDLTGGVDEPPAAV